MKRNRCFIFILALHIFVWGSLLCGSPAEAASTVFVNEDGDDSNDGSSEHPYKTLKAAMEEVNEGKAESIKIGKGSFSGDVTFMDNVEVTGAGRGDTTITGQITFRKKGSLKDLSIKATRNGVELGKGSNGVIKNVEISGARNVGIDVLAGNGSLTLSNSRLHNNGKGVFLQTGTKATITDNDFYNNDEEALDIRQNTSGLIKGNNIEKNKESGIEIILGSTDFTISNNKIQKNGASGIANQFYSFNKKVGSVKIRNNTITGNRNYDIDCKTPSGGSGGPGYWARSVILENNAFTNREEPVRARCKIIQDGTEEELKKLEEDEKKIQAEAVEKNETVTETRKRHAQEEQEQQQIVEEKVQHAEGIVQDNQYQELEDQVTHKNRVDKFLRGTQGKGLDAYRKKIEEDSTALEQAKQMLAQDILFISDTDLQSRLSVQEMRLEQKKSDLERLEQDKGSVVKLFSNIDLLKRLKILLYAFPV